MPQEALEAVGAVTEINIGYVVAVLLVPAVATLFGLYIKAQGTIKDLQTERLKDIRDMMNQNHDALMIIDKVAEAQKDVNADMKDISRTISEFVSTAKTQHDAMLSNQKRIEERLK